MIKKRVASACFGLVSVVASTVVTMTWPSLDPAIGIPILWCCGAVLLLAIILWFWPARKSPAVHNPEKGRLTKRPSVLAEKQAHREEQAKQRAILEAENERTRRNNPFHRGQPEWWTLHRALRYLVYESTWGSSQAYPASENDFDALVSQEFVEALARGEVRSRGKKGIAFSNDQRTTEPIHADYWITGFVQPYGEIVLADDTRCVAGNPSENFTFRGVVVDSNDLKRRWPLSQSELVPPLAIFCEALRSKIEMEKPSPQPL